MSSSLLRITAGLTICAGCSGLLCGCASDWCDELADICTQCPDDGSGMAAQDSCDKVVATGDEEVCEDRVELQFYEALGCGTLAED